MVDKNKAMKRDEDPVARWELREVQNQVDRNEKTGNTTDLKLDQIIQLLNTRPTTTEVDAKIELAVKNAIEKQDLKYAPIVQNNKVFLAALVTTGVGLIGSLLLLAATFARQA